MAQNSRGGGGQQPISSAEGSATNGMGRNCGLADCLHPGQQEVSIDEIEVDPVDGVCGSVGVRRDSFFDPYWWLRSGILCAATAGLLRPDSPVGVPFLRSRLGWRRVLG